MIGIPSARAEANNKNIIGKSFGLLAWIFYPKLEVLPGFFSLYSPILTVEYQLRSSTRLKEMDGPYSFRGTIKVLIYLLHLLPHKSEKANLLTCKIKCCFVLSRDTTGMCKAY
jgi:hypothetical protein